jgi:large subunit ribosomal protein L2
MGKRITAQRRGRGTSVYKAPSHRYLAEARHRTYDKKEKEGVVRGRVLDIVDDPGRTSPLMKVEFDGKKVRYLIAAEGVKVGDELTFGVLSSPLQGNTLPLSEIPEGTPIHNVEAQPGDGGRFIRSSGTYGLLITHDRERSVIQLPSGALKTVDSRCRASIGVVAGGGRRDKPILKAGKKWHMLKPKAKYWPIVRKVKMNVVNHPHGGGSGHPGKPTCVSRNAPPGRKVGLIAARRTGGR